MLDDVQQNLLQKRDACIKVVKTWDELVEALGQKKMILALWCDEEKRMSKHEQRVRLEQQKHTAHLWISLNSMKAARSQGCPTSVCQQQVQSLALYRQTHS